MYHYKHICLFIASENKFGQIAFEETLQTDKFEL